MNEVIKKLEDLLRFILSEIVESGQDISIRTIETHNIAMAINFLRNFLSILSPAHFFYFMLYVHWVQWTFRCFICQYKIFSLIISIFVIFQYLSISFISIIRIVYQAKMLPQNYVAIFLLNRKIGIINNIWDFNRFFILKLNIIIILSQ